ncbi:WhiB family transcriptional regulator [Streptomyces sp. CT34]|uniref:WhiB family transcriptional regulator n=1 Tax=Streptomyces sp. CT34 TaxID=1553907 RepID=UPI0005B9297A|nr:WhiB family transcriptional regulator [Streptomyces sp. CT34]
MQRQQPTPTRGFSRHRNATEGAEGILKNAALLQNAITELATRVVAVSDSILLADLELVVEEHGECRRYAPERWFLGAVGARTVARDLVRTEQERGICERCPVRDRCLSLAILTGDTRDSIHGGLLPVQQRRIAAVLRLPSRVEPTCPLAAAA